MLLLPWRQEEQGMVVLGRTRSMPALRKNGGETDWPSIPGCHLGDRTLTLINPFSLQDSEGRHEAVQQFYCHAGELAPAHHDVAAQGMATHHPDLEAGVTKSLNNMVLCMISEYHLTCLSQGLSYVSPVLPEAVKNLLPPLEEYRAGGNFQGTQDARVLERAKTLQVAVWLHCLDMAATGDREASYSLDACKHGRGPLLEFLLTPRASNLTFEEVVHRVLGENRDKMESSLNHVQGLQAQL